MTDNEKHLKEASEFIKAFEKEKEPERLREASLELEDIDLRREHNSKIRHKLRSDCLELWLTVLQMIDKHLDPSFDPKDVPQMSVMPPETKSGIQLPPGAAPSSIDDPQARQEYEKAIKDNRARQEYYLTQTEMREVNERVPSKVDAFIRNAFTTSESDRAEVRAAIDRIIKNELRKESLYRSTEPAPEE